MKNMRFTKEKAFEICSRQLPIPRFSSYDCSDCYYHDGRCEFGLEPHRNCESYRSDVPFTNMVRRDMLLNPDIIRENWDQLCQVDKELFIALYCEKE